MFSNPGGAKRVVFRLGSGLVLAALAYLVYLYYPLAKVLWVYKFREKETVAEIEEKEPLTEKVEPREINVDDFWINIPKIGANARVRANVSAYDKNDYLPVLKSNVVAHAKGSSFPGDGPSEMVYLFAHSTHQGLNMVRKNAIFYLLGEMERGDMVEVGFSGKIYKYQVYQTKIANADEVEYLDSRFDGREIVILQTCWPLGTDWKRLLIFAQLVEAI